MWGDCWGESEGKSGDEDEGVSKGDDDQGEVWVTWVWVIRIKGNLYLHIQRGSIV